MSASLMVGGVALAASENSRRCDRRPNNGKGDMVGAPGKGKGNGWENGWPGKCAAGNGGGEDGGDNSAGGGSTGGGSTGGGSTGGGSTGGGSTGGGSTGGGSTGGGSTGGGSTDTPVQSDSGDDHLIDIAVNTEVTLPTAAIQSGLDIATDGATINIIAALLASF